MNPVTNPYAPGAGTPPPLLAGRDGVIEAWDIVIGRAAAGNSFQPIVLSGLRGVGKTVLLLAFRPRQRGRVADRAVRGPPGRRSAGPGRRGPAADDPHRQPALAQQGAGRADRAHRGQLRPRRPGPPVAGGFRIELEPEPGYADTGDLETDLTELLVALGEGARDEGVGAALLIDELHEVPPEQLERAGRRRPPGQPGAPAGRRRRRRAAAGRSRPVRGPLVLRTALQHPPGRRRCRPTDTREAFEEPAAELGVSFEAAALDELVELSGGYPFFIQSYGKHVWDVADDSPIALDDVDLARPRAYRELVDSFFRPRYDRATPAERRYMHAMAELGDSPVSSTDVATRLGHDQPSRVSPQRDGLLTKGLIYAPDRGLLVFTVPHMADYLRKLPY